MTTMTIETLQNSKEYKYHHTGSRRGYVSRHSDGLVEEYDGRHGKGFVIVRPRWDTTQYVYVDYYIKEA